MYLQDHILQFLELYTKNLDLKHVALSIREGGFTFHKDHDYLCKEGNASGDFKLCLENPLSPMDDLSGGIRKIGIIRRLFSLALEVVKTNVLWSQSFVLVMIPDAQKMREKYVVD